MKDSILEQVMKIRKDKQNKVVLYNLAEGLMYSFSINPNGKDIIWYLGNGTESSNREVITTWAMQEMNKASFDPYEKGILPELCALFYDVLDSMQERNWV